MILDKYYIFYSSHIKSRIKGILTDFQKMERGYKIDLINLNWVTGETLKSLFDNKLITKSFFILDGYFSLERIEKIKLSQLYFDYYNEGKIFDIPKRRFLERSSNYNKRVREIETQNRIELKNRQERKDELEERNEREKENKPLLDRFKNKYIMEDLK